MLRAWDRGFSADRERFHCSTSSGRACPSRSPSRRYASSVNSWIQSRSEGAMGMPRSNPAPTSDPDQAGYRLTSDPRLILTSLAMRAQVAQEPGATEKEDFARLKQLYERVCHPHTIGELYNTEHGLDMEFRSDRGRYYLRRPEQRPADDPPDAPPVRHPADPPLDRPDRRAGAAPSSSCGKTACTPRFPAWGTTTSTSSPPTRRTSAIRSETSSTTRRARSPSHAVTS